MVGMVSLSSLKTRPLNAFRFGTTTALKPTTENPIESAAPQATPSAEVLKSQFLPATSIPKVTEAAPKESIMPVKEAWAKLPKELQAMLYPVVTPRNLSSLSELTQTAKMGLLEEASDILYECFVLTALQTGTLKDRLINQTKQFIQDNPDTATSLQKSMQHVKNLIADERTGTHEINRLAQTTGMDNEMAEDLLALTYLRIATLQMEDRFSKPHVKTRHQLIGEFWELMEHLPYDVKNTMGSSIVNGGYQKMQKQFPTIMNKLAEALQQTLGADITPETMHEFTRNKHFLRQGIRLTYLHHSDMNYDKRKHTSKAIEALVEVSLLDSAGAIS